MNSPPELKVNWNSILAGKETSRLLQRYWFVSLNEFSFDSSPKFAAESEKSMMLSIFKFKSSDRTGNADDSYDRVIFSRRFLIVSI